ARPVTGPTVPVPPSVAPAWTLTAPGCEPLTSRVPAIARVPPVFVLVPDSTSVPVPPFANREPATDSPRLPAKVVSPLLVTVLVRLAVSVAGPVNARSKAPMILTLPPSLTGLARLCGPPSARTAPAVRRIVPVPRALSLPTARVPAVRATPPLKVPGPDNSSVPAPALGRFDPPADSPTPPAHVV